MSLIVHRCTLCQHLDIHHSGTECSVGWCTKGPHAPQLGEPYVMPTFDTTTGDLVTTIAEPGSVYRGFGPVPLTVCGCERCHALYEATGGVAA
jgi:hypothetical protein